MIETNTGLRALYAAPGQRALQKQIAHLDPHCRRFIELSPFVVISSANAQGHMDASPRGGGPGFVRVQDERTLWIPDSPGNNRLDTLTNIIATREVGLLFMVPGIDETLRLNGTACLNDAADCTQTFRDDKRTPKLVIEVRVRDAYLHCAKAFMRSNLWSDRARVARNCYPSIAEVIRDQIGAAGPVETREQMLARYQADL